MFICSSLAHAQLKIQAEIRPRTEYRHGFKTLMNKDADPAFFTEQRSRLYFSYKQSKLQLQLNVQDVRIWGNANTVYKSDPALTNVHEAWAAIYLNPLWSIKAGRQEINYDNSRFMSHLAWQQQSISHDALLVRYENQEKKWKAHLGGAFNQNIPFEPAQLSGSFYSGVNNYKTMQYVWANKTWDKGQLSLLLQNDGRQRPDSTVAFRQTLGSFFQYNGKKTGLGAEVYYQTGKNAGGLDVNAYLVSLNLRWTAGKSQFTIGSDYLSGTAADEATDRSFAPLYGLNHAFYGYMDYFYAGNFHGQNGKITGLWDNYLKMVFNHTERTNITLFLHGFQSPVDILDTTNEKASAYLGTEVDVVYQHKFLEGIALLDVGYSQMFGTESLELIKGGDSSAFNNWIWMMLTIKPVLFDSAKLTEK